MNTRVKPGFRIKPYRRGRLLKVNLSERTSDTSKAAGETNERNQEEVVNGILAALDRLRWLSGFQMVVIVVYTLSHLDLTRLTAGLQTIADVVARGAWQVPVVIALGILVWLAIHLDILEFEPLDDRP